LLTPSVFLMNNYDRPSHINVGTGEDLSIRELAGMVGEIVYPEARLTFDASKPDGMPRKLLDVSRINALIGWRHRIGLARRDCFPRTSGSLRHLEVLRESRGLSSSDYVATQ
jgi:GDP-L-fucose synthase